MFVIVLSDEPYATVFGDLAKAHYLSHTLEAKGELLLRYDAVAHEQLPNGVALLSGQGPTPQTAANCPTFSPLAPGTAGPDEQVLGDGCVYPSSVKTLPGQLDAKHLTLARLRRRASTKRPGSRRRARTRRPARPTRPPPAARTRPSATRSSTSTRSRAPPPARRATSALALKADLTGSAASTPALLLHRPRPLPRRQPHAVRAGRARRGLRAPGARSKAVVPAIPASKAYKQGGLLVITVDEAPSTGEFADSSSCCGQPPFPNYTSPALAHGGGDVGALLLSPFVKGGTTTQEPYNHFSLLRTIEDLFGARATSATPRCRR